MNTVMSLHWVSLHWVSRFRYLLLVLFLLSGLFEHAPTLFAAPEQDSKEAMKEANVKLVKLLDEIDDLFYKKKTDDNGNDFYTIVWESGSETSKILLRLRELGHYQNEYIYAINSWTLVAGSDDPMPPAVIKTVATANDSLAIGSYSCSKDFKQVYSNMNGILENTTAGTIWMYVGYLHSNRIQLKEQVDQALAGEGQ